VSDLTKQLVETKQLARNELAAAKREQRAELSALQLAARSVPSLTSTIEKQKATLERLKAGLSESQKEARAEQTAAREARRVTQTEREATASDIAALKERLLLAERPDSERVAELSESLEQASSRAEAAATAADSFRREATVARSKAGKEAGAAERATERFRLVQEELKARQAEWASDAKRLEIELAEANGAVERLEKELARAMKRIAEAEERAAEAAKHEAARAKEEKSAAAKSDATGPTGGAVAPTGESLGTEGASSRSAMTTDTPDAPATSHTIGTVLAGAETQTTAPAASLIIGTLLGAALASGWAVPPMPPLTVPAMPGLALRLPDIKPTDIAMPPMPFPEAPRMPEVSGAASAVRRQAREATGQTEAAAEAARKKGLDRLLGGGTAEQASQKEASATEGGFKIVRGKRVPLAE